MLYKFLMTQLKNRKQKDWVSQVLEDIKDLKLNVDMEEIKLMKKSKLKHILKNSTEEKALEELEKKKAKHSKVMNIKHKQIKMQKYLKSNGLKMNQEEVQTIFKLRSRMTNVKTNFRGKYDNFECELCNQKFVTRSQSNSHRKEKHGNERPHECQLCEKKFKRNGTLLAHMKIIHSVAN